MPLSHQDTLPEAERAPTNSQGCRPMLQRVTPRTVSRSRHGRAVGMLLLATALWGMSFPLAKAAAAAQAAGLPAGASTWFLTALALVFRFALAAVLLAVGSVQALRNLSRQELWQGVGLGVFCGSGMLLQIDGLNYTNASTAAFLTASYAVLIPIIVALQRRRFPPWLVVLSVGLVAAGTAILAGVDFRHFRLGRGEWENLVASLFFSAQIFWLERPVFRENRTGPTTVIMFAVAAALSVPVLFLTARGPGEIPATLVGSPVGILLLLALTLVCTVCTFTLMNHWQRELEATEAGLIYCVEPVFAALFSLGLPGLLSAWAAIDYPNEGLTVRLLIGGGLITLANVLIQFKATAVTPLR